jgi:predicted RNA-binding protein YlqC (UPF0109 family)
MEDLLKLIIKNLIGTDNFKITKEETEGVIIFNLMVPNEFVGLIIGKEGKCIKAIRTLLKIRATLENLRVDLNVKPLDE